MPSLEVQCDQHFLEYVQRPLSLEEFSGLAELAPSTELSKYHALLNTTTTSLTLAQNKYSNFFVARDACLSRILPFLLCHIEKPAKGEHVFIPADLQGQRRDGGTTRVFWLVYDIDGALSLKRLRKLCKRFGCMLVVYTTFNHLADGKTEKYRVVVFLAEPIALDEVGQDGYRAIYKAIGNTLFDDGQFDTSCCNPSHPFYLPTHAPGEADNHFAYLEPGPLYDWRKIWETLKTRLKQERVMHQKRAEERQAMRLTQSGDEVIRQISECLKHIPADDYATWFKVLCAIMHETNCSPEGRQLAHDWSETVPEKYCFDETERLLDEIESKDHPTPATMGTLIWLAQKKIRNFFLG